MDNLYYQIGGGNCSLCGSPGTNKSTCPLNPAAANKNWAKHPLAGNPPAGLAQAPIVNIPKAPVAPINLAAFPMPPAAPVIPKPIIHKPAYLRKVPVALIKPLKAIVPIKAAVKPVRISTSPPYLRKDCANAQTLLGDQTDDLEANPHLYVTESGHCFNVEEELLPSFKQGDFKNPYTMQLFSPQELESMLKYPHMTEPNRAAMRYKIAGGLSDREIAVLSHNPEVFREIYKAGYACFIDHTDRYMYSEEQTFFYAIKAISKLLQSIETLPDGDRVIFGNMKTGRETLTTILAGINGECIHGGGLKLVKLFMRQYHMLPKESRPDVSDLGIIGMDHDTDVNDEAQKNAYLLCFNTENSIFELNFTLLYIYDEPASGRDDYASYFMDVYPDNSTLFGYERPPPFTNAWQVSVWGSVKHKYAYGDGGQALNLIIRTLPLLNYTKPIRY